MRLWQPAAHPAALPVHSIRRAADRHQRGHGAPHRGPKRPRRAAGSIHPPCPRQPPEGPGCATRRPAAPPTALPVPSTHRASDHHRRGHGAAPGSPQRPRRAAPVPSIRRAADPHQRGHGAASGSPQRPRRAAGVMIKHSFNGKEKGKIFPLVFPFQLFLGKSRKIH